MQSGNTQFSVNIFKYYRNLQKCSYPKNTSFHAPMRLRGQMKSVSSDSHSLQKTGNPPKLNICLLSEDKRSRQLLQKGTRRILRTNKKRQKLTPF
jgi:hypothetical protein